MGYDLLLLSNSRMHGQPPLAHLGPALDAFLQGRATIHFAPFALRDHEGYTASIRAALAPRGIRVVGLHAVADPLAELAHAEVLFVGGGNSFRLLKQLYALGLLDVVRRRVASGELRYMGASAGSNMACPSLRTTNDMPIVQPPSFEAFGLIPFQINPHYIDADPSSTHMGETRAQRIAEFLEENAVPVLGLREGAWLRRQDDRLTLHGPTGAVLFERGAEPQPYAEGADLSFLLGRSPAFDTVS
ncbi:dipeptidase PepE [Chloroflexia bacterium SDU3-3]|nr:dipeptidase PepE [Chloroflexia bacterium SDU3-3]